MASRLSEIQALHSQIAREEERLRRSEAAQRWETVDSRARSVRRLNDLRIECLAKLSRGRRAEILGLTRDGIAQLRREVEQITLQCRLHVTTRIRDLRAAPGAVRDVFVVGTATCAGPETAAEAAPPVGAGVSAGASPSVVPFVPFGWPSG